MLALKFNKTAAIPNVIEPSSVYLIPNAVDGFLDIYVSNADGTRVLKTISHQDVETIVQNKITEVLSQAIQIVTKVYHFESTNRLTIQHNLNTTNYAYTIVNQNGDKVWAPDSNVSGNEFTVNFTEVEAGTISVVFYVNT